MEIEENAYYATSLESNKVVLVKKLTDEDITVVFPSEKSLKQFFDGDESVAGLAHPNMDDQFVMSLNLGKLLLTEKIPSEVIAGESGNINFWVLGVHHGLNPNSERKIEVNSVYGVENSNGLDSALIPPSLNSIKAVLVKNMSDEEVTVVFPSEYGGEDFMEGEVTMGLNVAQKILTQRIPVEEFAAQMGKRSFWVLGGDDPVSRKRPRIDDEDESGLVASDPFAMVLARGEPYDASFKDWLGTITPLSDFMGSNFVDEQIRKMIYKLFTFILHLKLSKVPLSLLESCFDPNNFVIVSNNVLKFKELEVVRFTEDTFVENCQSLKRFVLSTFFANHQFSELPCCMQQVLTLFDSPSYCYDLIKHHFAFMSDCGRISFILGWDIRSKAFDMAWWNELLKACGLMMDEDSKALALGKWKSVASKYSYTDEVLKGSVYKKPNTGVREFDLMTFARYCCVHLLDRNYLDKGVKARHPRLQSHLANNNLEYSQMSKVVIAVFKEHITGFQKHLFDTKPDLMRAMGPHEQFYGV